MKKLMITMAMTGLVSLAWAPAIHAQTPDPKIEWAKKVVALQQGPELDRLVAQITGRSAQELIDKWAPKLEANVPKTGQQKASENLNTELKKYSSDISQLIGKQITKTNADVLVPAYVERFTLDELKQIASFFESPAIKKYQSTAPELGTLFIQKLLDASREDVSARAGQFDAAALKIIGTTPAARGAGKPAKK